MKYVVVTGGVVSGLGKGISISSLGVLLKACGLRVTSIKIDPYLNVDAGTMSPFEHGEVFVLEDGGEADLDLGNYERFLDVTLTRNHNITTGKVYRQVIEKERRGDYLGRTVQVIPHVTDAIQEWILDVSKLSVDGLPGSPDVCLIEVGGTVGDIESLVFLEALRQLRIRVGAANCMFFHVSLVPVLGSVGEQKTKPTQHTVKELRSVGISPDAIICRSGDALHESTTRKLALFCQVPPSHVLAVHDVSNIYHVPLLLHAQNAERVIADALGIALPRAPVLDGWRRMATRVDTSAVGVRIALVGKYNGLQDSYLSVIKALKHAAVAVDRNLTVDWIDAQALEAKALETDREAYEQSWEALRAVDGILVPGGFGERGVEGKIAAIQFAREHKIPFLGICLGMQCAVIEHARNVLGLAGANSTEFDAKSPHPVVIFMPEINPDQMGGTMRLGARVTIIRNRPGETTSLAGDVYGGRDQVLERHRHRYEVNPEYVERVQESGLIFSGTDDRVVRMEIVERDRREHPFFFAAQYHPEFNSRPLRPSPPFLGFVAASAKLAGFLPFKCFKGPWGPGEEIDALDLLDEAILATPAAPAAAGADAAAAASAAGGGAAGGGGAGTALPARSD